VNRSGSQNASKHAAAAAEKTELANGVLMPGTAWASCCFRKLFRKKRIRLLGHALP